MSEGDWTQEDLYCSTKGQVLLIAGEKSVFQLNAQHEQNQRPLRIAQWKKMTVVERRELVRKTIGATVRAEPTAGASGDGPQSRPVCESIGAIQRSGYVIEKLILKYSDNIPLPALAFIPEKPNGHACLYLHGDSMKADAAPGGPIEVLVKQGQIVLAAELRGVGETETGHDKRDYGRGRFGRDVQEIFLAYLISRSYVGMRADDVATWGSFLKTYKTTDDRPNELHLIAIGETAIPALHAIALEPDRFASVQLRGMIRSWAEVVRTPETLDQAVNVVHGALNHYDLSDLIELAGDKNIRVEQPVDVLGKPIATAIQP